MATGYFSLVLHAHLPFVRHPEDPTVMEEQWLYEAITGTYLPLLQMFEGLIARQRPLPLHGLAVGAADHDADRRSAQAALRRAPRQADRARRTRRSTAPSTSRTTSGWRTCTATASSRCATPGAATRATWCARSACCRTPATSRSSPRPRRTRSSRSWTATGRPCAPRCTSPPTCTRSTSAVARGACGWANAATSPASTSCCARRPSATSSSTSHAILFADRQPAYGVYAPAVLPHRRGRVRARHRIVGAGVERQARLPGRSALPRLLPGHRLRPADGLHRPVHPPGRAPDVHRLQVPRHHPRQAARQVGLRPRHRARQGRPARRRTSAATCEKQVRAPARAAWIARRIIVSPYDAELYGHWWYEGPIFLGDVFRQLHFDQNVVETITPGDYLDRHPTNQVATPCASSWGLKGYNEQWLNETNAWTYRHLHVAGERMVELARRHPARRHADRRAR